MGASSYTIKWAEAQWDQLQRGEATLSAHEQRALMLVYRQAWLKLKSEFEDLQYGVLRDVMDRIERAQESSPEIVYRNSTWRVRDDDESDERDL